MHRIENISAAPRWLERVLVSPGTGEAGHRGLIVPDADWTTSSRACWLAVPPETAAGKLPHVLLNIPTIAARPSWVTTYTGPPESPFWLTTPLAMVNQPLLTASTVPQLSPVITPK